MHVPSQKTCTYILTDLFKGTHKTVRTHRLESENLGFVHRGAGQSETSFPTFLLTGASTHTAIRLLADKTFSLCHVCPQGEESQRGISCEVGGRGVVFSRML